MSAGLKAGAVDRVSRSDQTLAGECASGSLSAGLGESAAAAYALGLGATGLTFYDDDVTAFFSPHAAGKSVMFLLALGVPGRR